MRAAIVLFALIALRSAALADATVPHPSSALPVLTPAHVVILDEPDQCSCVVPEGHFLKPTWTQVRRIERWLPRALAEDAAQPGAVFPDEILAQVATDHRYYLGYVAKNGHRIVEVHGYTPYEPRGKMLRFCPCIDDGGSSVWEMSFDLTAGTHGRVVHLGD